MNTISKKEVNRRIAEHWRARGDAYDHAGDALFSTHFGSNIERAERKNIATQLKQEAKNCYKHAEAVLKYR